MRIKQLLYPGFFMMIIISLLIITRQCIEEYNPNIDTKDDLLVINGSIVRGMEQQTIYISRSTSVEHPGFLAETNCNVFVTDHMDHKFQFEEASPGMYIAEIDSSYLLTGAKFKLTVETPDKQVYASDFEEMYDGPQIDSLYFASETAYSELRNRYENGQRLNVDVYARDDFTGYYRWKIHETWEQRSTNERIDSMLVGVDSVFITTFKWDTLNSEWVRDRAIPIPKFEYLNKPDTFHICYLDSEVDDVFLSSTSNIVTNTRKRVPLQFITHIPKLTFRYSCLVSQYSLSEGAYMYLHNKLAETKESGELYYTQPSQNQSNIKNIKNDQETVLGYFWVSEMKQKRIFYGGPYIGGLGCSPRKFFDVEDFYLQDPNGRFGEFIFNDTMWSPVYIINGNK